MKNLFIYALSSILFIGSASAHPGDLSYSQEITQLPGATASDVTPKKKTAVSKKKTSSRKGSIGGKKGNTAVKGATAWKTVTGTSGIELKVYKGSSRGFEYNIQIPSKGFDTFLKGLNLELKGTTPTSQGVSSKIQTLSRNHIVDGVSYAPIISSNQFFQFRGAEFENSGNSGHLETYTSIFQVTENGYKLLTATDIFPSTKKSELERVLDNNIKTVANKIDEYPQSPSNDGYVFFLDTDGVMFLFYRCEIFACAWGNIAIKIPYSELKSCMNPDIYTLATSQTDVIRYPLQKFNDCWTDEDNSIIDIRETL